LTADRVVWSCLDRSDTLEDMSDLLPLASVACRLYPGASRTKGAALVRAGQYEEALDCFQAASTAHVPHPSDFCFQAIAYARLDRMPEARERLENAIRWIELADRQKLPDIELSKPAWSNWA